MAIRMLNNKRGQKIFVTIMVAIVVFIFAMIVSSPLKEQVDISMNSSNLNCSGYNITATHQATCTVVDLSLFYFLGVCIAVGIAFIAGQRNITGVLTTIAVFVVVVVILTPLKTFIVTFRDPTHLNCTASTISLGARLACIFVDVWLFWFFAACMAAAISFLVAKNIPTKITEQ